MSLRVDTVLRVKHGSGNIKGTNGPDLRDNQWHYAAAVVAENIATEDVRIYDRALSQDEIAWLAGRTKPFDKPF